MTGRRGALLTLLALTLWVLLPPAWHLWRGEVLAGYDLRHEYVPLRDWLEQHWQATGSVPDWNRHIFSGMPNITVHRASLLYLPDFFFCWTGAWRGYSLSAALHLLWAALGAYALARTWRMPAWAAGFAGAVFVGSFPLRLMLVEGHVPLMRCTAYIPWVLAMLELLLRRPTLPRFMILALLLAMQSAAWMPDMLLYAGYCYVLYGGWRAAQRRAWRGAGLALFAGLLAAVVLLPTVGPIVVQLPDLTRGNGTTPENRATLRVLPQLVAPGLLGTPATRDFGVVRRADGKTSVEEYPYWEETLFVGVLGLALAGAGVGARWPRRRMLLGLLLVTLLLAWSPALLTEMLPGMTLFRAPSRLLAVAALWLALAAGRGLQQAARDRAANLRPGLVGFALLALLLILLRGLLAPLAMLLLGHERGMLAMTLDVRPAMLRAGVLLLGTALAALAVMRCNVRTRALGLALLAIIELAWHGQPYVHWTTLPEQLPQASALFEEQAPYRTVLPQNDALLLGVEGTNGREPFRLRRYLRLLERFNDEPEREQFSELQLKTVAPIALGMLNVRWVLSRPALFWPNLQERGRYPSVESWHIYEHGPAQPRAALLAANGDSVSAGGVMWDEYGDDRMGLTVQAEQPARLLVRNVYARGWLATVNGLPVDIMPWQDIFFTLPVPAGRAQVVLTYVLPGKVVTDQFARAWLWLLAVVTLLAWWRARRRGAA